jgi:hypothetical protein
MQCTMNCLAKMLIIDFGYNIAIGFVCNKVLDFIVLRRMFLHLPFFMYRKSYKIGYLPIISNFFYIFFIILSYYKSSSYKDLEKYFENSLKFIFLFQIVPIILHP